MNVYITYDRYEHDEWYSIYHIETNKKRAIKHFKEIDLVDFISYGPDDCHSFQLQKVVMTPKQYKELLILSKNDTSQSKLVEFMIGIFDETDYKVETISCTDGCSDVWDVVKYYCEQNGDDPDDDDVLYEAQEILFENDELFTKILKEYIEIFY